MIDQEPRNHGLLLRESERVLLHILRREGALSKAELARLSGMSAQGVAVIMDGLVKHDLVIKGPKQRGRVGQPSTPLLLNPAGALSLGVHVAPDGVALCLLDFLGELLEERSIAVDGDDSVVPVDAIVEELAALLGTLDDAARAKVMGVGICAPTSLIDQCSDKASRQGGYRASRSVTLQHRIEQSFGLTAHCVNDVYAASIGESSLGEARELDDFLYVYIARMMGASVVLDGKPIGRDDVMSSNLHILPTRRATDQGLAVQQRLGAVASLAPLENDLKASGHSLDDVFQGRFEENDVSERFISWSVTAIDALTQAISAASAVIPLRSVVVDSGIPRDELYEMVAAINARVKSDVPEGVIPAEVMPGRHGARAKVIGAGILPIQREFAPDILPSYAVPGRRAA